MLNSNIQSIDEDIRLILTEELSPAAQSTALVVQAQQALVEAQAFDLQALGRVPSFITLIDGAVTIWRGLQMLNAIRPSSVITFEFNVFEDVVPFALQALIDRSPEASGRYKRSWFVMVDGRRVAPEDVPPGSSVIIANDQPYSRKIDVGHMKMSVPPGIVEAARQDVMGRFGNSVTVERVMIPLPDGYVLKGSFHKGPGPKARRGLQKDTQAGAAMTYPALAIEMR